MLDQIKHEIAVLKAEIESWRRPHFVAALVFLIFVAIATALSGPIWAISFLALCAFGARCLSSNRYVYILVMMAAMRIPQTTTIGWIGWMVLVVGVGFTILANPNSGHDTQTVTPKPDRQ